MAQTLEVRLGSFFPAAERPAGILASRWSDAAGELELILDGKKVYEAKASSYDVPAETVVIGRNSIGASSCGAKFSGRIIGSARAELR